VTGNAETRRALVSVHDLTPGHLPRVIRILDLLREARIPPPSLLVVPGSGWTQETLEILKDLVDQGYTLAGHGWIHRCEDKRTLFHRFHGLLISRDQAEHLSKPREAVLDLMTRCYQWFGESGLPSPELYVPPAWAMGTVRRKDLKVLPFSHYEVLRGLLDGRTGRLRWLPLVGYEADTAFRKISLKVLNGMNVKLGEWTRRPVRISLHPPDLDYLLGKDLEALVREPWRFVDEGEALAS
jgi:predicted deacetylase